LRVAALDYDAAALVHARAAYPQAVGARAIRANLAALPLADASVAAVTSFQVIEHLWTPWEFLAECARVLRPGGLLVVTTPNRLTFSPGLRRGEKPPNPFHVREFDAEELRATIAAHLPVTQLLGVSHGPRLAAWEAEHGNLIDAQLAAAPPQWPGHLVELVRSVTADDFTLAPLRGNDPGVDLEVLDLVVLARRGSDE
jgi:SAM-dependent methyltransferase